MSTRAPHDLTKLGDYVGASADAKRNDSDQAFRQAAAGVSATVPLAPLTPTGTRGNLTFTGGLLTAYVLPT